MILKGSFSLYRVFTDSCLSTTTEDTVSVELDIYCEIKRKKEDNSNYKKKEGRKREKTFKFTLIQMSTGQSDYKQSKCLYMYI